MGESFAPFPHRLFAYARDGLEVSLMVHLYAAAHRAFWKPIPVNVRALAAQHAVKKHRVEWLLKALADDGFAEKAVVKSGARRDGMRLRIFDPSIPETNADTDRTWNQTTALGCNLQAC